MRKISGISILLGIILGGLFGGGVWLAYRNVFSPDAALYGSNTFVSIFLTTNQVFFGKVESMNHDYVVLRDTFYLQQQSDSSAAQPSFVLQKTGSELHGPQDVMFVSRTQIVLIQPLKSDSQVVGTIKDYEASLKKSKDSGAPTQTTGASGN
jgi:hypothetical protein